MKWSLTHRTRKYLHRTCAVTTFVALNAVPWLPASAQTVTVDEELDFGAVRILDNSAQYQISFNGGGGYTADPEFIFYRTPQIGEVTLTGFTPNTKMKITFTPDPAFSAPQSAGGPSFEVINLFTIPANVKTNGGGSISFDVGGTLQTDGGGTPYQDTDFSGAITINVEEDP